MLYDLALYYTRYLQKYMDLQFMHCP